MIELVGKTSAVEARWSRCHTQAERFGIVRTQKTTRRARVSMRLVGHQDVDVLRQFPPIQSVQARHLDRCIRIVSRVAGHCHANGAGRQARLLDQGANVLLDDFAAMGHDKGAQTRLQDEPLERAGDHEGLAAPERHHEQQASGWMGFRPRKHLGDGISLMRSRFVGLAHRQLSAVHGRP